MANQVSHPPPPPPPRSRTYGNDRRDILYHSSEAGRQQASDSDRRPAERPFYNRDNLGNQYTNSHSNRGHSDQRYNDRHQNSFTRSSQGHESGPYSHMNGSGSHNRGVAGHKRKPDDQYGPEHGKTHRSRPETVASVPSFGLPVYQATQSVQRSTQKPRASLFGLHEQPLDDSALIGDDSADEDDDQDVDEEQAYAQLGTKLIFEYEGSVVKLDSEADLVRWQAERRRKWPSNARVAEKQAERQRTGSERKRLLEAAYALRQPGFKFRPSRHARQMLEHNTDHQGVVEDSRTAVDRTEAAPIAAKTPGLLGMSIYDSDENDDDNDEEPEETKPMMHGAAPDVVQQADQGLHVTEDDQNCAPEQVSSKEPQRDPSDNGICKYFFHQGRCKQGDQCAYSHVLQEDRRGKSTTSRRAASDNIRKAGKSSRRKGIHELLREQESEAANKLALQVIKYLGGVGFFNRTA